MVEPGDASQRAAAVALAAVGIPIVAEVVASVTGSGPAVGYGLVFQIGTVLGAAVATWFATRRGLWWLVPAQPLIVVPVAVAGTVLNEPSGTNRAQFGTDAATALQHAFLITLAAIAAVVVVSVVKAATGRTDRSDGPAQGRGRPGRPGRRRADAAPSASSV
ncbi:MAG: hypothetical protein HOW97_05505, partial [Catenulispora sp.]|nr:hypothetical protein [Catenulispora sp.]